MNNINYIPCNSFIQSNEKIGLPAYITSISEIQQHLTLDSDSIQKLIAIDRGTPGAHMKTLGLVAVIKKDEAYLFEKGSFRLTKELYPINLEEKAAHPYQIEVPPFLEIEAVWGTTPQQDGDNVFGETVQLLLNKDRIKIPQVKATEATLAYYGATIIPEGTAISFPSEELPIFRMEFGERWFHEGVQTEQFGGVFLEYHHDQPHFHYAYEEGSFYMLAKWSDESKTRLQITAFELPVGQGVYTKKGAIHNDVAVKGNLLIGYMKTKDFSVAFLRNNALDNKRVQVDL